MFKQLYQYTEMHSLILLGGKKVVIFLIEIVQIFFHQTPSFCRIPRDLKEIQI